MPSPHSSGATQADAREMANRLGTGLIEFSIEDAMAAYDRTLGEPAAGITAENLQARIRGNLMMALSNSRGWLILTTANKSETSVGYSTLYGDMAGGLAPIKDVPKTLVYDLCRHRNGSSPVIPESIISRPPSAELRPGQLDSDSLPDYDELDRILKMYVEDDLGPAEIADRGEDPVLPQASPTSLEGFPTKADIVKLYAVASGRDVSDLSYYIAFGFWKLTCIIAGVYARYAGGAFACIYLAPYNYHRIHMPLAGRLVATRYIPGALYSVNAATARAIPGLFARNERVVCEFDTALGPLAMALVGALFVGSIETVYAGEINPPRARGGGVRDVTEGLGTELDRGAELGRFNMGSTVVVLAGNPAIGFGGHPGPGDAVRMGQVLARAQ